MKLHQMTSNYFNLELGEWEPMVENFACEVNVNQTLSQKTLFVTFKGPVIVNLTQACLLNLSYTYEAWLSMPAFMKQSDQEGLSGGSRGILDSAVSSSSTSGMKL